MTLFHLAMAMVQIVVDSSNQNPLLLVEVPVLGHLVELPQVAEAKHLQVLTSTVPLLLRWQPHCCVVCNGGRISFLIFWYYLQVPLSFKLCPARLCLSWKKLVLSATKLLWLAFRARPSSLSLSATWLWLVTTDSTRLSISWSLSGTALESSSAIFNLNNRYLLS